jgi:cytidine deaminase
MRANGTTISEHTRLSVVQVDLTAGKEAAFLAIARDFEAAFKKKGYGLVEMIHDEANPLRFYRVWYWASAAAADECQADVEVQALIVRLFQIARVTQVVNGARRPVSHRLLIDDYRTVVEADRRTGFERRMEDAGHPEGDRRRDGTRRAGSRRVRGRCGDVDLIGAARWAREFSEAAFSTLKVGAAIETVDGTVFTGCNIENATYGLTICAERVAMFKGLSEGHRVFTRLAIVAGKDTQVPPCGACRQILWEFGGNLEILLANMAGEKSEHRLKDLLPLPFDARLV